MIRNDVWIRSIFHVGSLVSSSSPPLRLFRVLQFHSLGQDRFLYLCRELTTGIVWLFDEPQLRLAVLAWSPATHP